MKKSVWTAGCLVLVVASASAQVSPQKTNDSQNEAIELLRRTIAEQQNHPNQIIRAAASATNNGAASGRRAELERQYLEGKLTAKQYQKALEQWRQEEEKRSAAEADKQRVLQALREQSTAKPAPPPAKPPVKRAPAPRDSAPPATTPAPASPPPPPAPPEPTPQQKTISDVEARIDEMLRLKAAREKAGLSNAVAATNSVPATPQTKRQRLDALLRRYVDGQITDAEYNQKRGQILAEPE